MPFNYNREVIDLIESSVRNFKALPLNLGAIPGSGGGEGAPPGGYIGWLPQTRVAYDSDELAYSGLLYAPSGSLYDNLAHIRYRLNILESGGSIIVTDDNNSLSYLDTTNLHFVGSGVVVTDLGSGNVRVRIDAVGSGGGITGSGISESYANTKYLRLDTTNNPLTGPLDIAPTNDYGIYLVTDGDNTTLDIEQYANGGAIGADLIFGYQEADTPDVSSIFLDGVRWRNGAGNFTGNWIHFEQNNVAKFDVDKDGNVNIPTGSTYKINGTPHTHTPTGDYTSPFLLMGG